MVKIEYGLTDLIGVMSMEINGGHKTRLCRMCLQNQQRNVFIATCKSFHSLQEPYQARKDARYLMTYISKLEKPMLT